MIFSPSPEEQQSALYKDFVVFQEVFPEVQKALKLCLVTRSMPYIAAPTICLISCSRSPSFFFCTLGVPTPNKLSPLILTSVPTPLPNCQTLSFWFPALNLLAVTPHRISPLRLPHIETSSLEAFLDSDLTAFDL